MRPILFTSLVFFFFWGCSNSVENNKTQIQTESIPALAVEIPLQEIEDTIKDNNKNSIVPEHVRFEEYDPIPRERYEDVPAPVRHILSKGTTSPKIFLFLTLGLEYSTITVPNPSFCSNLQPGLGAGVWICAVKLMTIKKENKKINLFITI